MARVEEKGKRKKEKGERRESRREGLGRWEWLGHFPSETWEEKGSGRKGSVKGKAREGAR